MLNLEGLRSVADAIRKGPAVSYPPAFGDALQELHDACAAALEGRKAAEKEYARQQQEKAEGRAAAHLRQALISYQTTEYGRLRNVLMEEARRDVSRDPELEGKLRGKPRQDELFRAMVRDRYKVVRDRYVVEKGSKWDETVLALALGEINVPPTGLPELPAKSVQERIAKRTKLSRKVFGGEKLTPTEAIDWEEKRD